MPAAAALAGRVGFARPFSCLRGVSGGTEMAAGKGTPSIHQPTRRGGGEGASVAGRRYWQCGPME